MGTPEGQQQRGTGDPDRALEIAGQCLQALAASAAHAGERVAAEAKALDERGYGRRETDRIRMLAGRIGGLGAEAARLARSIAEQDLSPGPVAPTAETGPSMESFAQESTSTATPHQPSVIPEEPPAPVAPTRAQPPAHVARATKPEAQPAPQPEAPPTPQPEAQPSPQREPGAQSSPPRPANPPLPQAPPRAVARQPETSMAPTTEPPPIAAPEPPSAPARPRSYDEALAQRSQPAREQSARAQAAPQPDPEPSQQPQPAQQARAETSPPSQPANGGQVAEGSAQAVRVLALQMAASGVSRSQAENRLKSEFGISAPPGVLDEVFGNRG